MATATKGPTNELGQTSNVIEGLQGMVPWTSFVQEYEHVPELRFPTSVQTYEHMRNDAQIAGLYMGATLPIRRYAWHVDPGNAREEVVTNFAEDIGLPIKGQEPTRPLRTKNRFSHDDHLRHALLSLLYGFAYFEQVGEIVDGRWRLRKLAYRMPHSISEVMVARDGGLLGIKQQFGLEAPPIPVDRLVAYVWDREGGNWYGRSLLRAMFREYIIKDRLLRVDAIKHERNGMGVPTARGTIPDVSPQALAAAQQVASAWRAGEDSGAALPYGVDIELKGVTGNLPDTLASIRYADQMMAKVFVQMFGELGQTPNGSRALGDTLEGHWDDSQHTIAKQYAVTTSAHVAEDWVDWNYGPEEPAPSIDFDPGPEELALADMATAVEKGLIVVDEELRTYLRQRYSLPKASGAPNAAPNAPPTPIGAPVATRRKARTGTKFFTEVRTALAQPTTFRRELLEHEVTSAADFEAMDAQWRSTLDGLLGDWEDVTAAEVEELTAQVQAASSLEELAEVRATAVGQGTLAEAMKNAARDGAAQARAEAVAQGVKIATPALPEAVDQVLEARASAIDTLLARSISETGGREAVRLAGGALDNEAIAGSVRDHLESLSTSYLSDRLGGAVTSAQNYGRAETFKVAEEEAKSASYYSSELLDTNTCENCSAIDGTNFDTLDAANAEYPTGGYVDCLGLDRCRGTVVANFEA